MARGNENIKQIKIDSYLNKQYRFSDGVMTMREFLDKMIASGNISLDFSSCGSYKRQGERFDKKPNWTVFSGDNGFDCGRIGAAYVNEAAGLGLDIDAIEKAGLDKWKRENKPTTPGLHAGYMGRW